MTSSKSCAHTFRLPALIWYQNQIGAMSGCWDILVLERKTPLSHFEPCILSKSSWWLRYKDWTYGWSYYMDGFSIFYSPKGEVVLDHMASVTVNSRINSVLLLAQHRTIMLGYPYSDCIKGTSQKKSWLRSEKMENSPGFRLIPRKTANSKVVMQNVFISFEFCLFWNLIEH